MKGVKAVIVTKGTSKIVDPTVLCTQSLSGIVLMCEAVYLNL